MFTAALKTELKMEPRAERNSHDATVAVITSTLNAELKMEPSTEGYSHSATVATMTSFYEFIKRMYGDVVVLKYPPPSGWPQITELPGGVWQPTPAVIQLLRHIPYFVRERSWDPPVLLEGARPVDYRQSFVFIAGEIAKEKRREEEKKERGQVSASSASEEREQPAEDDGRLPPHMFELARQYRHGYNIIVDTKRGVVIWWDDSDRDPAVGGPVGDAEPEDDCVKRWWKNGWKAAPTFRIETFFEMCKEQYTLLNWIPLLETGGSDVQELAKYGSPGAEEQERIKIMRDCGWPGEQWNPQRAIAETRKWAGEDPDGSA